MKIFAFNLILVLATGVQALEISEERLVVRVLSDTAFSGRNLVVTSLDANRLPAVFQIHASFRSHIEKHGHEISAHEIRNGDILNVRGNYTNGRLYASQITVNENSPSWLVYDRERDYHALQGIVTEINAPELWFTLDTGNQYRIFADRARIWDANGISEFTNLRKGIFVLVRGNVNEYFVDAERIEINRLTIIP